MEKYSMILMVSLSALLSSCGSTSTAPPKYEANLNFDQSPNQNPGINVENA